MPDNLITPTLFGHQAFNPPLVHGKKYRPATCLMTKTTPRSVDMTIERPAQTVPVRQTLAQIDNPGDAPRPAP